MKKQIEYNEQVKTLLLTVEALKNAGGLPEEISEKADEFCDYLTDYIYGRINSHDFGSDAINEFLVASSIMNASL